MTAENEIHRRIAGQGAITFAEFMGLALYWPGGGYYTGIQDPIGAPGDFYTSPLVHPAFGALLSIQLFQMWRLMDRPNPFIVLELGAGNGLLCRDIAEYSKNLPGGFSNSLRYICVDAGSRPGLERALSAMGDNPDISRIAAGVGGLGSVEPRASLPLGKFRGCVLSNELLDAFPVHQAKLERGKLLEAYVVLEQGELAIIHDEPSTPELENRLNEHGVTLAERQTVEICLGLSDWARMVSEALEAGFVLTVDYGKEAEELYSNELRPKGTLTTFYRHTQIDAPLRRIGYQDITSQVDFTAVMNEGRNFGLQPLGYSTQKEFLHNLGIQRWQRGLTSLGLPQGQTEANRAGMVDLLRPGGLGDFKVLVQAKGVSNTALWGFQTGDREHELDALLHSLPPPLMTPEHLDIRRSWNLGGEIQMEEYWPPFTALDGNEEGQL